MAPDRAPRLRNGVFAAATAVGLAGLFYHLRNVSRRPGAPSWESLFYGAPLLAPEALVLAGRAGQAAMQLEHAEPRGRRGQRGAAAFRNCRSTTARRS